MSDLDKTQLSEALLKDMKDFARTGEDPIFWLVNGKDASIDEIITRMQSANIESVVGLGYKTMDQWSRSNPPRAVRKSIAPITNTDRYSSFALIEDANHYGKLRYPLVASYAAKNLFFGTKTFPDYSRFINRIRSAYKVKVIEKNDSGELFSYKRKGKVSAMLKNIGYGALNLCRKLFKKQIFKPNASYKGKIVINGSIAVGENNRYKFSQQEKLTRIIYALTKVTSKDIAKQNKINLDNRVMAYANLLANVLVCRAINYGSNNANRIVEASLSLQMCNTLAGLEVDSQTLKQANDIAKQTALFTINKLGISKNEIMTAMRATGYEYHTEPKTIIDALVPRRTLVNEDVFVNHAEQLLGIRHNTANKAEKTKDKTNEQKNTNKENLSASQKHEKEALDNPPPPDVIYMGPPKEDNQENVNTKEENVLNNPKPDDVIYLGTTKDEGIDINNTDDLKQSDETYNENFNTDDMIEYAEMVSDLYSEGTPKSKVQTLAEHTGVKTKDVYITRASAEKYIDRVVLSSIRKDIDKDLNKIDSSEDTSKVTQRAKRRYNFLEHLYTYYDRNKNKDSQSLQQNVDKELDSIEVGDNVYAHSYAKSMVDLRHSIVDDIFGENDKIIKPEGKEIAGLVNDHTEKKYSAKLSAYVKGALKKCLRTVFKEIDGKSFEQKNLVEPDSSK